MSKNHADQAKQATKKSGVTTKVTVHPEKSDRKESIEVIFEKEGGTNESKTIVVDISDEEETNKEIKEEDETEDADSQKLISEPPSQEVIQHLQDDMKNESESNHGSVKGNEQSDDSGPEEINPNFKLEEYTPLEENNNESQHNNDIMMVIEQTEPNHDVGSIQEESNNNTYIGDESNLLSNNSELLNKLIDSNGKY